jgi:hypothetical protein
MLALVVAWGVTTPGWYLAQLLHVRIVTIDDLSNKLLPPLTEHRPPQGPLRTRQELRVNELRDTVPQLVDRHSDLDIEAPVFIAGGQGPCYVLDRTGNDEYVNARNSDYDSG